MPMRRQVPVVEELEPRILYSADLMPLHVPVDSTVGSTLDPGAGEQALVRHEVVFVDEGVGEVDHLIASILGADDESVSREVIRISGAEDGIAAISRALEGRSGVNAVHVLSHGSPGEVILGSSVLSGDSLFARAGEIAGWGDALSADGDLLLYGCDVASTPDGRALVDDLAKLTGAEVAASDDKTGSSLLGGDWLLEYQAGAIDSAIALDANARAAFAGVLADTTVHSYEPSFSEMGDQAYEVKLGLSAGQTFRYDSPAATYTVDKIGLVLYRASDATAGQTLTVSLRSSWSGAVIASGTVSSNGLATSEAWTAVTLSSQATLNDNQTYYIRIDSDGAGKVYLGVDDSGTYATGDLLNKDGVAQGGKDAAFRIIQANAAPVITSNGGGSTASVSVPENTTAVTTVVATDADAGDTLTYSISGGTDAARFAINGSTGALSFIAAPDYDAPTDAGGNNVYDVTVQVADGNGGIDTQAIAVTVLEANTAPTFSVPVIAPQSVTFSASSTGSSVVGAPDGSWYVVSNIGNNFGVAHYKADGTLDTTYGTGGKKEFDIFGNEDILYDATVQSDGKLVLVGSAYNTGASMYLHLVVRLNTNGSLDTTFSGDGIWTRQQSSTGSDMLYGVTIQSDGKIVASGTWYNGTSAEVLVYRLNANGTLDTTFSSDGIATLDTSGQHDYGDRVFMDGTKIVVAGRSGADLSIVRFNSDGSLDTTFSGNGWDVVNFGATEAPTGAALQADGKYLVSFTSDGNFHVVRYNTNGTLDTTFDGDGHVITDIGATDHAQDVVYLPDGKILVSGYSNVSGSNQIVLVRYNPNGSLDTSFGTGGIQTVATASATTTSDSYLTSSGALGIVGTASSNTLFTVAGPNGSTTGGNTLDGAPTYVEDGTSVVLDADVQIFDAELSAANNFNGASLTLARNGGADTEDVFSATGSLGSIAAASGNLVVGGTTIGTYVNSAGALAFSFNASATNSLVNQAMRQIAYANTSDTPPASVQIDWTFNDGNSGAQGVGGALTANGSTTVTITATNDAPVASNDAASGYENDDISGNVLTNDSDVDSVSITASLVSGPAHGSLALNPDGSFTYTPDTDWHGTDSFTYTAHDGARDSNVATVTLTVIPDQLVANDDAVVADEDTPLIIDPTANDSEFATIIEFTQPANGSLTSNGDGTLTYTPDANYSGSDSFVYQIADSRDGLSHYWSLDGAATDSVGTANGTLNGTTTVAG